MTPDNKELVEIVADAIHDASNEDDWLSPERAASIALTAIDSSGSLVAMLTKSGNAAKSLVVFAVGSDGDED